MEVVLRQLQASERAFRAIWENADLRRVEAAWALATFAYSGLNVVVMVYGYESGGASAVGLVALLRVLPGALCAPFTSVLADRYRRELIMLISNLLRAALVGVMAAVVVAGGSPWIVYALTALVGIAGSNFRPAQAALLPSLARTPDELTAANVTASTIQALGLLVAPGIACVLIAVVDTAAGFVLVGSLFAASALLVLRIRARSVPEKREETVPVAGRLLAGFEALVEDPRLRLVIGLIALQTFVAGGLAVMNVVVAIRLLQFGKAGVGYLNSAIGVGGLIGTVVVAGLVGRRRLGGWFIAGISLWSIPLALVGIWPHKPVAILGLGVVGLANMLSDVAGFTLVQRAAPQSVLARVFGILEMTIYTAMALGSITAPAVISAIGIRASLIVFGLLLPACVLVFGIRLLRIDRAAAPPAALDVLRAIPIFAPLPAPTLEELAAHAFPVTVESGAYVFKQGDSGDRFYVILSGEVEVLIDDEPVRRQGPGEYFGEIALLRDIPRTASVRTLSETKLLALERSHFVHAVTGSPTSSEAANLVISERLGLAPVG
jgi:MFS family permease